LNINMQLEGAVLGKCGELVVIDLKERKLHNLLWRKCLRLELCTKKVYSLSWMNLNYFLWLIPNSLSMLIMLFRIRKIFIWLWTCCSEETWGFILLGKESSIKNRLNFFVHVYCRLSKLFMDKGLFTEILNQKIWFLMI
jgi:hypothetical protein